VAPLNAGVRSFNVALEVQNTGSNHMTRGNAVDTNVFNAYIAEYNSLRAEVLARVQTQNQTFNFLLVILGASITAIITTANSAKPEHLPPVILAVALLLPLITCPLAYMFFDNELMIHAIGSYIYYDRRRKIADITGDPHLFESIADFKYLPPSTHSVFHPISRGRWILFCIPAYVPLVFVPLYVYTRRDILAGYSIIIVASAVFVYVLDLYADYILARAIKWVFDNNKYQLAMAETAKRSNKPLDASPRS
jgi:hypothetical protein